MSTEDNNEQPTLTTEDSIKDATEATASATIEPTLVATEEALSGETAEQAEL